MEELLDFMFDVMSAAVSILFDIVFGTEQEIERAITRASCSNLFECNTSHSKCLDRLRRVVRGRLLSCGAVGHNSAELCSSESRNVARRQDARRPSI